MNIWPVVCNFWLQTMSWSVPSVQISQKASLAWALRAGHQILYWFFCCFSLSVCRHTNTSVSWWPCRGQKTTSRNCPLLLPCVFWLCQAWCQKPLNHLTAPPSSNFKVLPDPDLCLFDTSVCLNVQVWTLCRFCTTVFL